MRFHLTLLALFSVMLTVGGCAPAPEEQAAEGEDELTPTEPFYVDADAHMAQEEGTSTY